MEILNEESSETAPIIKNPVPVSINKDPEPFDHVNPVLPVSINKGPEPFDHVNPVLPVSINKDPEPFDHVNPVAITKVTITTENQESDTVTIANEDQESDPSDSSKPIESDPDLITNEDQESDPSDSSEPIESDPDLITNEDQESDPSDSSKPIMSEDSTEGYYGPYYDEYGPYPDPDPTDHVIPMSDSSGGYGEEVYDWDDDYGVPQPLSSEEKEIWTVQQLDMIRDRLCYGDRLRILAYKAASEWVDQLIWLCDEYKINFEVVKYAGQPSTAPPIPPMVCVFGPICAPSSPAASPSGGSKLSDDQEKSDPDGLGKEVYDCGDHDYGTLPPLSLEEKEVWTEHQLEMIMDRLSDADVVTIVANKAAVRYVGDTYVVDRLKRLCVHNQINFEVVEYAGQPSTAVVEYAGQPSTVVFGAGSICPPSPPSPPAASPSGGSKVSNNKDPPVPVTITSDQSDPIDQSDNVIAKSPRTPAVVVFGAGAICPPSPQAASPSGGSG